MSAAQIEKGIILKGIGGFYYVKTADGVLECKPKGIFRKQGVTPLAGDLVTVEPGETNVISSIETRRNCFVRPPVANVTRLFIVVSSCDPAPNRLVIDKLCAISQRKDIKPVLVFTKTDVSEAQRVMEIYLRSGFCVLDCSEGRDAEKQLAPLLGDGINVFIGNSGVGKSTLLNRICAGLSLATGETSRALGRGKHTTRAVELYPYLGGYIVDTPGFSAVDAQRGEQIKKEELQYCFPEFASHIENCRFTGCAHIKEKGCAVREAVESGVIPQERYDSYVALYEEAKQLKDWETGAD